MEHPQFTVSIASLPRHYFRVEAILYPRETDLVFSLPAWTPGSYMIRDFSQHLHRLVVSDAETETEVPWESLDHSTWRVPRAPRKTKLTYFVYAYEDYSVRTCYLDTHFAFINSPALFVYPREGIQESVEIRFAVQDYFRFVYSPLPRSERDIFVFLCKDYDTLYDSPFHLSNKTSVHFETEGCMHELLVEGDVSSSFISNLSKDLERITSTQIQWMGESPNPYYLFVLNLSQSAYGGLEHAACSINFFDPMQIGNSENYLGLLELLSHEYFHLWNVKRIRPIALGPFDYQKPNYTKELWIAEGITSFLDGYFLYYSQIFSLDEYLNRIQGDILFLLDSPADEWMSLEESSFTAWNKYYKKNANSHNLGVSYYTKGFGLALLLDIRLREVSETRVSLQNVMQSLYKKYYKEKSRGFTKEEFFLEIKSLVGWDISSEFLPLLEKRVRLPLEDYLEKVGLYINEGSTEADWGISLKEKKGNFFVSKIYHHISDPNADIHLEDEVIAVNGRRLQSGQWEYWKRNLSPGEKVRLLLVHHNQTKEILYSMGESKVNRRLQFYPEQSLSESQRKLAASLFMYLVP